VLHFRNCLFLLLRYRSLSTSLERHGVAALVIGKYDVGPPARRRAYKLIYLVARVSDPSIAVSPGNRIGVNSLIKGKGER
jgi:hypothetical protein